ncbi:MAG: MerC domain-containing protein [Pseudobdellovibrionaceae bacterium]|nr:MerC domain-containing protein [Pseudobdellovibrionaceae bacterium]
MTTSIKSIGAYPRDSTAMLLSAGCAIHCFVQPALLATIPLIGLPLVSADFEVWSIVVTLLMSLHAIWSGFRRHENYRPLAFATAGGFFLSWSFLGLNYEEHASDEWIFTLSGCLLLLGSHLSNIRHLRHQEWTEKKF